MADPLPDRLSELLIRRLGGDLCQVRSVDFGEAGLVHEEIALQHVAMAAEAAEHTELARSVGELRGSWRR